MMREQNLTANHCSIFGYSKPCNFLFFGTPQSHAAVHFRMQRMLLDSIQTSRCVPHVSGWSGLKRTVLIQIRLLLTNFLPWAVQLKTPMVQESLPRLVLWDTDIVCGNFFWSIVQLLIFLCNLLKNKVGFDQQFSRLSQGLSNLTPRRQDYY